MIIALTGHRPNKLNNEYNLVGPMSDYLYGRLIIVLKERKPEAIITGMALGADMLWAFAAQDLGIKVVAAIPCRDQEKVWPKNSQDMYWEILNGPNVEIQYITDGPYNNKVMDLRNKWMVDNCDLLVAIWDGTKGGTGNCINYAKSINKEILRINPKDIY